MKKIIINASSNYTTPKSYFTIFSERASASFEPKVPPFSLINMSACPLEKQGANGEPNILAH
jgi:hypothetical protein